MRVLVSGATGFVGTTLVFPLLAREPSIVGFDNHNDCYDSAIKEAQLARHASHSLYTRLSIDLVDRNVMEACFATHKSQRLVNLATQAGVATLSNPLAHIDGNIVGSAHILEACRHQGVEHLVRAISASVYGANTTMPFDPLDCRTPAVPLCRQ
jgi:UDP-glucuronate 4-epimerase